MGTRVITITNHTERHRQTSNSKSNRVRYNSRALGSLFVRNGLFLTHSTNDGDQEVLASVEILADLGSEFTLRNLDVVLGNTILSHEIEETVIDIDELEFITDDIGNIHVVGGRTDILQLFPGKDVEGNKMNLGVTMLTGLGGRHVDDFARAAFDHDVAVFAESGALHGVGRGGPSAGLLKGLIVMFIVGHVCCVF